MPFDDRYAIAREGHALTCVDSAGVAHWCIRCGALWLNRRIAGASAAAGVWEQADQCGRTRQTAEAPRCRPSTAAGGDNRVADQRLMLRALTSGWHCEQILMGDGAEGWHWSRPTFFHRETYSIPGRWIDGPVVDERSRCMLLTASK